MKEAERAIQQNEIDYQSVLNPALQALQAASNPAPVAASTGKKLSSMGAIRALQTLHNPTTQVVTKQPTTAIVPPPEVAAAPKAETPSNTTYATGSASPAAKKILSEKGIEATAITGTGKDGRITKEDAVKAVPAMGQQVNVEGRGVSRSKLSMLRRKVAERLVTAKNETAMLTTFNEVDMSPIFELRKQYKETFKDKFIISDWGLWGLFRSLPFD